MKWVVFGLTISSSWGNGHATLWRGLCTALAARSHHVVFFERDQPYYRDTRDLWDLEQGQLVLYESWPSIASRAARELADADVAIVTSYCPDGAPASLLVLDRCRGRRLFYDMDTPVTLASLQAGAWPEYLPSGGLSEFDLVLSFTGGAALRLLQERLGARVVAPLYGHVDPAVHRPVPPIPELRSDLSYLGTYAEDRQEAVEELLLRPARWAPERRFLLGGSLYPPLRLPPNVTHIEHVAPSQHGAFFASSRLTLNVTRSTMARLGYCPSGRLFEAAACGATIVSDWFEGLDEFFLPGSEVLIARSRKDVGGALEERDTVISSIGRCARERVLQDHTAQRRVDQLERLVESFPRGRVASSRTVQLPVLGEV